MTTSQVIHEQELVTGAQNLTEKALTGADILIEDGASCAATTELGTLLQSCVSYTSSNRQGASLANKAKKVPFDNSLSPPIVMSSQLNNKTPSEGVGSTGQGLTTHADNTSTEAAENPSSALSSRQLLSAAIDDFFVGEAAERKVLSEIVERTREPLEIAPGILVVSDNRAGARWIQAIHILTQAVERLRER